MSFEEFNKKKNELMNMLPQESSLIKDGKFKDDFAKFTEFEDENGNIMLIRYSNTDYNFRGNKYCKYILCNEKTGSREEGIAQIKGGQKVHIEDKERVLKIKEFIESQKQDYQSGSKKLIEYFKKCEVELIGYKEDKTFHDKFWYLYQIKGLNSFYQILMPEKNLSELNYNQAIEETKNEDFIKINEIPDPRVNNKFLRDSDKQESTKSDNKEKLKKLLFYMPICLTLIYPISELVLWILGHIGSMFSIEQITDFAVKSLPYGYHPNCNWFLYLSVNLSYLLIGAICSMYFFSAKNKWVSITTDIVALSLLVVLFVPKIFDIFSIISAVLVVLSIIALIGSKAGG